MYDPIGGLSRIRDLFLAYISTAFRINDPETSAARRDLLEQHATLTLDPIVEMVPRYKTSELAIEDLAGTKGAHLVESLTESERIAFAELVLSGLFPGAPAEGSLQRKSLFKPYEHQLDMLARGLCDGAPCIITSGTGSGKTESFMLPLLAQIVKESSSWPTGREIGDDWFLRSRARFALHRANEAGDRPKALRAIILYPMNALVEDQMVRLRKALDSEEARKAMDHRLNGNRIFFGRYNGETPVSGFREHPRLNDSEWWKKKAQRQRTSLRRQLQAMAATQDAVRKNDAERVQKDPRAEPNRFLFASTDGNELVDRWNMQATPPDILVTNHAMLNIMLVREVDSPILNETRAWLQSHDEARFTLVIDELHLLRGSAGAELAGLLRILFRRLGLDTVEHRHKLHVFASSASLPVKTEEDAAASCRYLWNMFGDAGTYASQGASGARGPEDWRDSIIEGERRPPPASNDFRDLQSLADLAVVLDEGHQTIPSGALAKAVAALTGSDELSSSNVAAAVEQAAGLLASGCAARPAHLDELSSEIFGRIDHAALRGLASVRAIADMPAGSLPENVVLDRGKLDSLPSFRIHAFFRSVEGMFASLRSDGTGATIWGKPSIERGEAFDSDEGFGRLRRFEMLYCESCGDLFVGGRRGGRPDGPLVSILPAPQDLESLPEIAASGRFEEASYLDYVLFWPTPDAPNCVDPAYRWDMAYLDPTTGVVKRGGETGHIPGHLLSRHVSLDMSDLHDRKGASPSTAVPYCCPRCAADYSPRYRAKNSKRQGGRLSPIRSFRTGFAKTSQILATELVSSLRAQGGDGKLVAFSDSRQDAARLAMRIEEEHQRDLRRELLVEAAEKSLPTKLPQQSEIAALEAEVARAIQEGNWGLVGTLGTSIAEMQRLIEASKHQASVPLQALLEFADSTLDETTIRPVLNGLIEIGVNPAAGPDLGILAKQRWNWYFDQTDQKYRWKTGYTNEDRIKISQGRKAILDEQAPDATDLLFNKTYFAFEETGLGWPSLFGREGYGPDESKKDALLRILGDAYKILPNRYMDYGDAPPIRDYDGLSERLKNLAEKLFDDPRQEIEGFLAWLAAPPRNITNGIIDVSNLNLRLVLPDGCYWRCEVCSRVHLHNALGKCTRCAAPIGAPSGNAADLRSENYLGYRVERSRRPREGAFRLRCAELTGQAGRPAERLRDFKGIFIKESEETADQYALREKASEVDLISVTTTMEVGVDIGGLQAVYQANMPPQRFNYQQRVGRAGRRGQAFSTVLTVCRSRSHDLHYFRHPLKITNDQPPAPFVTTGLVDVPARLLRKFWLVAAFENLRENAGDDWAGDRVVPADVHGEFLLCRDYYDDRLDWRSKLDKALRVTAGVRDEIAKAVAAAASINVVTLLSTVTRERVLSELDERADANRDRLEGLASMLADSGLLPLYGMPTRARNLYVGLAFNGRLGDVPEWDTIDRDQDVAVHEFAPGNTIVREKRLHLCVGFTGNLLPPSENPQDNVVTPIDDWAREITQIGQCGSCGSWEIDREGTSECSHCGTPIDSENYHRCISPAAYRTDFREKDEEGIALPRRNMTFASVSSNHLRTDADNLIVLFEERSRVHKVNAGSATEEGKLPGFAVDEATDKKAGSWRPSKDKPFRRSLTLEKQAIDTTVVASDDMRWRTSHEDGSPISGWLISSKATNALHLSALAVSPDLRITEVDVNIMAQDRDPTLTSIRAAAVSATQILVLRAALELDVAPEEFEALPPRAKGNGDDARPYLQIADSLVNGSGFCRHLQENGPQSIGTMLASILDDASSWPLNAVEIEDHRAKCDQACYRCLQRYGNRNLHGLLDWRLGLSYLRAMRDPNFSCGLGGDFLVPELQDWREIAKGYVDGIEAFTPGTRKRTLGALDLPAFSIDEGARTWAVVVHPMWRRQGLDQRLSLPRDVKYIDTFELARRPIFAIEQLRRN